ncbi:unnamed protein product, partial [Choristocarpus tenellus]
TLVHVSTAFVHGCNTGTPAEPLPENLPALRGLDPERLYQSAREREAGDATTKAEVQQQQLRRRRSGPGESEALSAMKSLGHPNTYTFTKALAEHLLVRAVEAYNRRWGRGRRVLCGQCLSGGESGGGGGGDDGEPTQGLGGVALRLCVMRPSIIGPSWMFPWPGWTGERPSTVTGCLVLLLRRVVKTFNLGPHTSPVIPVDVVSRAIVHQALGWGHSSQDFDKSVCAKIKDWGECPSPKSVRVCLLKGISFHNVAWATGKPLVTAMMVHTGEPSTTLSHRKEVLLAQQQQGEGEGEGEEEGRMPSFREFSGLMYDYAVLRGLRPASEALAMRLSLAASSSSLTSSLRSPTPASYSGG